MKRILVTGVMMLAVAAIALAVDTKTDYDHSADFTKYHTFQWKEPKAANEVVANSLVLSRIHNSVAELLGTKGIRQDPTNPDLFVVAHVAARNLQDIDFLPPAGGWRNWGWMGPDVVVNNYVQGTMILDMVDAHTNKLVWRAISTDTGSDLLDVQKAKTIDKMVEESLEHFPPQEKSSKTPLD